MKIEELKLKMRCEMPNCMNLAEIKIEKSGFFKSAGLKLCKQCMEELYRELASRIVPKSPDNMLNKKISTKRSKVNE